MDLPAVEHVELEADGRVLPAQALGLDLAPRLVHQLAHHRVEGVAIDRRRARERRQQHHPLRALVHVDDVHDRRAVGAEHRREREHDRARDLPHVAGDVGRTAAAEGEQREVRRLVAAQRHLLADRRRHLVVDDAPDQRGRLDDRQPERLGDPLADRLLGGVAVQRHAPREELVRAEVAEHEVGVGDRRLGPAELVGHRARVGAGALRADLEPVAQRAVDPGDRAAAGTDRQRLQHGGRDHPLVDDRVELVVAHRVPDDQADVERRAADVGGDDVVRAELAGDVTRADQAGDRPAVVRAATRSS